MLVINTLDDLFKTKEFKEYCKNMWIEFDKKNPEASKIQYAEYFITVGIITAEKSRYMQNDIQQKVK